MWITLFIALAVIYIIGVSICCYTATIENVEFHDGGFLSMGYTTCDHRDLTPKDARHSLIWPLVILAYGICIAAYSIVYLANNMFKVFLLIFNFRYAKTKMYEVVEEWLSNIESKF